MVQSKLVMGRIGRGFYTHEGLASFPKVMLSLHITMILESCWGTTTWFSSISHQYLYCFLPTEILDFKRAISNTLEDHLPFQSAQISRLIHDYLHLEKLIQLIPFPWPLLILQQAFKESFSTCFWGSPQWTLWLSHFPSLEGQSDRSIS